AARFHNVAFSLLTGCIFPRKYGRAVKKGVAENPPLWGRIIHEKIGLVSAWEAVSDPPRAGRLYQ
ncbi:MAG: hypothetical protein MPK75_06800, partial [Alphaproteobacteria bacterium]|nr:hypothetical protein [Alphaproteobacteria bacterium]